MLIDLHTHTYPLSDDSFVSVDDLIDRAKTLGLDGICLTEHDQFWNLEEVKSLSIRHEFLVLSGSEINTDAGHILVFGLQEYVFGMHKPAFLRQVANKVGGVMIAAHPYRRRYPRGIHPSPEQVDEALDRATGEELFGACQAIETLNGRGKPEENRFSQFLSQRLGLAGTGGSDVHREEHIGKACTRFHNRIASLDDLVRELNSGACEAETGYAS